MKHLKTLVLAIALLFGSTSIMNAQSKIAHINTQELVSAMPEFNAAQAEMLKLQKTYEVQIQDMITEYQNKAKQYDGEASTQTQETNANRMQELQGIEQSIGQFRQTADQEMRTKQGALLKPINDKAEAAILKVGKALGFDYVLDSSLGQGVILAGGKDIMAEVKIELGF